MTETKHTPGPWDIEVVDNRDCGRGIDQVVFSKTPCPLGLHKDKTFVVSVAGVCGKSEANAKLIAAAPEMLEVLQILVKVFNKQYEDIDPLQAFASLDRAMGVIDKATLTSA